MFLARRLASLQPSTLLKCEALHTHILQILLFLNVSYILQNTCNDMSQLFLKELKNHKTIFIQKQSLIGVLLRTCSLKQFVKKFIFRQNYKLQSKTSKNKLLYIYFSSFFFKSFIRTTCFKKKYQQWLSCTANFEIQFHL